MTPNPMTPNLNAALVAARKEFGPLHKNAVNAFLKKQDGSPHRFADLAAIIDVIEDVLLSHGVVVLQWPGGTETMAEVTTELRHVSGEMASSTARCPATKSDPQGYGAAFTYLRRFALEGTMGLRAQDDDGNTASKRSAPKEEKKPAKVESAQVPKPSVEDVKILVESFAALGVTVADLEKRLGWPLATMSGNDMAGLRKFYREARDAKKPDPDELTRRAVQKQAEEAFKSAEKSLGISPVVKSERVEANAVFAGFVERIKAAKSEAEATLIHGESAGKVTKAESTALGRAVKDRAFLLAEAAKKPAEPRTDDISF